MGKSVRECLCLLGVATAVCFVGALDAQATLVNLGPGSFTPLAPQINFDEVGLGTTNPVYNFPGLPGLGDVTVSFEGIFVGQGTSGVSPVTITGSPTPGVALALDPSGPDTYTTMDGSNPSSPVLTGTPLFNGPVSVLFSTPVAGVGLEGGYFDAVGGTTIEAFDSLGNSLGSITNTQLGLEFYGLADSTGANVISCISFYITGSEPAGFAIDDLTFGSAQDIPDLVPEPVTMAGLLLGMGALGGYIRRRR